MFGLDWKCSERQYGVRKLANVAIPMDDGVRLGADIFLPDGVEGPVPVLLGMNYYPREFQTDAPIKITAHGLNKGWIESGNPSFYCRRGYAMVNANVRGIGSSEGFFQYGGPREARDTREVIRWLAKQDWCDGNVGMFGVSAFAITQQSVAVLKPEELKCIFAPFAWSDWYRDMAYHGGILAKRWHLSWLTHLDNVRVESFTKQRLGEAEYQKRIDEALADPDIFADPGLVEALQHHESWINPIITDVVLNYLDSDFWQERTNHYPNTDIPAFLGACWYNYCFHLPGAFRSWRNWRGPKKMVIGPPVYLDRPLYQYQYESLRWFDYWLKGIDTKIMDEPPIRLVDPFGPRQRDATSGAVENSQELAASRNEMDSLLSARARSTGRARALPRRRFHFLRRLAVRPRRALVQVGRPGGRDRGLRSHPAQSVRLQHRVRRVLLRHPVRHRPGRQRRRDHARLAAGLTTQGGRRQVHDPGRPTIPTTSANLWSRGRSICSNINLVANARSFQTGHGSVSGSEVPTSTRQPSTPSTL